MGSKLIIVRQYKIATLRRVWQGIRNSLFAKGVIGDTRFCLLYKGYGVLFGLNMSFNWPCLTKIPARDPCCEIDCKFYLKKGYSSRNIG